MIIELPLANLSGNKSVVAVKARSETSIILEKQMKGFSEYSSVAFPTFSNLFI